MRSLNIEEIGIISGGEMGNPNVGVFQSFWGELAKEVGKSIIVEAIISGITSFASAYWDNLGNGNSNAFAGLPPQTYAPGFSAPPSGTPGTPGFVGPPAPTTP